MEPWLWSALGGMGILVLALLAKIYALRKAAKEIEEAFADRLITGSNALIGISSRDKRMQYLAASISAQLRMLRAERRRFQQGDAELKNAVTNISHDLRTPLTAICGYLELLEQEEKSETFSRYLAIISNRAEMLISLTEELFRYSVIVSKKPSALETVNVGRVLEESIAAFYTALHDCGITPKIQIPQEPVLRALDPAALSRVFANLLSNAIKYSDGDLEIILKETGEIRFSNQASALDEVQVGKLFDRFYTVEAARKSAGLGLSIAKALVEQMMGRIQAQYEAGRLTILIFLLPDNQ